MSSPAATSSSSSSSSCSSCSSTYLAAEIQKANVPFEMVRRSIPSAAELKPNEVVIRVHACGVCHGDVITRAGTWPSGQVFPRVCGHEVVGNITALPSFHSTVPARFTVGIRVGRGRHGFSCFQCERCARGDLMNCDKFMVTGVHSDGGYQEYMVAPWQSLVLVPDALSSEDAAPLLCAGLTVFNALRNSHVRVPGLVAVQGIGGLGHLAIQYAAKMGYHVAAISRGATRKELAMKLGAHEYIDSSVTDPVKALKALGGAALIIATAFDSDAIAALVDGLGPHGQIAVIGSDVKPMKVIPTQLIWGSKALQGHASGTPMDSQDALQFAALHNVRPMIECFPLEKAEEAYERMMSGKATFRVVLQTQHHSSK